MGKKIKIFLILAVLVAIIGVLILSRQTEEVVLEAVPPTVKVETPQTGSIYLYSELIGTIEPNQMIYVIPKMAGEVISINFEAGDYVTQGQVLCTIDSDALTSAALTVETTRVSMEDAAKNLERMQILYEVGDISAQALEQVQSGYEMARLQYETAKNGYDLQAKYTKVTAPIDGIIETKNIDLHDMASSASHIAVISSQDETCVSMEVSEKVMKAIEVGDILEIDKSGTIYQAEIIEIASMVSQASGLFQVKARVENGEALLTGSKVKVTLTVDKAENVMVLPSSAIYFADGAPFVYIYNDGLAQKQDIVAGIYDSEKMEVISGLSSDNQVIVTWSGDLTDGAAVNKADAE